MCDQTLEHIHADLAILGAAGITEDGFWIHNQMLVSAQRKMIAAAEHTLFALDRSKFGRKALALTAPFSTRFTIVTDTRPAAGIVNALAVCGAKLEVAPPTPAAG